MPDGGVPGIRGPLVRLEVKMFYRWLVAMAAILAVAAGCWKYNP